MSTVMLPTRCMLHSTTKTTIPTISSTLKYPVSLGSIKSVSKSFGVKASSGFRAMAMGAVYKVKIIGPNGEVHEFEAPEDTYILDAAEEAGVELAYSCRAGECSTYAGKKEEHP